MTFERTDFWNLLVAVLAGLAVGVEREWSGHATGPRARFAGIRTFTMLGLVAGLSGWLWTEGLQGPALVFLAGLGALVIVAYLAASRRDVDGTTEVAAFVVLITGVLAGIGLTRLASGIVAITLLLLVEKKRLHGLVSKLDLTEIRAGVRFAVMAAVVLPLLPSGPYGPWGGVRPRQLWALVLFFSGLSFLGYIARRVAGVRKGYAIAGTLGGLLSSTTVTLTMARTSEDHPAAGRALAAGALGANMMLFPRVLGASLVLAPALGAALWPSFIVPALIAAAGMLIGLRSRHAPERLPKDKNPLQFGAALKLTLLFQVVLFFVKFATAKFGDTGLYGSSALLGLADVDALTISTAQLAKTGTDAVVAARALTLGITANTIVKFFIAVSIGRGAYRVLVGIGLALITAALAAAVAWR